MNKERDSYTITVNVNTIYEVLYYYDDIFKDIISDIIRYFSIYYKSNKKTMIAIDYYKLTLISLRKLFEPKMKTKFRESPKTGKIEYPKEDGQLNFMQWINRFYKMINDVDYDDSFLSENKENLKDSLLKLKTSLAEFEKIHNDNEIIYHGRSITHPLKDRIHNYASKYVAHSISRSSIERWEYNNKVFPLDEEIKNLVKIISNIENDYTNLIYYFNNNEKVEEIDYSIPFEDKIIGYFKGFTKEYIKNK